MIASILESYVYNYLNIFEHPQNKDLYVRLLSILQNENCNLLKRIGSHFKLYFVLKTSHYVWNIIFAYYMSLFKLHFKLELIQPFLYITLTLDV